MPRTRYPLWLCQKPDHLVWPTQSYIRRNLVESAYFFPFPSNSKPSGNNSTIGGIIETNSVCNQQTLRNLFFVLFPVSNSKPSGNQFCRKGVNFKSPVANPQETERKRVPCSYPSGVGLVDPKLWSDMCQICTLVSPNLVWLGCSWKFHFYNCTADFQGAIWTVDGLKVLCKTNIGDT